MKIFDWFKKKEKLPLTDEEIFNEFKNCIEKIFEGANVDITIEDRFTIRSGYSHLDGNIVIVIRDNKLKLYYRDVLDNSSPDEVIGIFFKDYIRDQKLSKILGV